MTTAEITVAVRDIRTVAARESFSIKYHRAGRGAEEGDPFDKTV